MKFVVPESKQLESSKKSQDSKANEDSTTNLNSISKSSHNLPPNAPELPYLDPAWSSPPIHDFHFEIIRQGSSLGTSDTLSKSKFIVGRLPFCDIPLDHPSISRYHAIIQFKSDECFIYDLGSSHGTFLNKSEIAKRKYIQIRVGDMIRFGASSRLYLFQGYEDPLLDALKSNSTQSKKVRPQPVVDGEKLEVSWGFQDDAYEGDEWGGQLELAQSSIERSNINQSEYYFQDPKKALKIFLENNGAEMTVAYSQATGLDDDEDVILAKLEIDGLQGPFMATGKGKKKAKAERDACLEACAKLDKLGILRGTKQTYESTKDREKRLNEIFGDDDEPDSYLDRTQKDHSKQSESQIETLDSLIEKRNDILNIIKEFDNEIQNHNQKQNNELDEVEDELDSFMNTVNSTLVTETIKKLQEKKIEQIKELNRIEKLVKLATPKGKVYQAAQLESITKAISNSQPAIQNTTKPKESTSHHNPPKEVSTNPTIKPNTTSPKRSTSPIQATQKRKMEPDTTTEDLTDLQFKKRQSFVPLSKEQMDSQYQLENDFVDFISPDQKQHSEEITKLKSSYGY
ncbi:hypothetical protein BC833DRAFT_602094 [Globomyces pollinis-pini]|nr:hypothetical protein BC833DRAFT_602094 [Globomyces pollinis-pini]